MSSLRRSLLAVPAQCVTSSSLKPAVELLRARCNVIGLRGLHQTSLRGKTELSSSLSSSTSIKRGEDRAEKAEKEVRDMSRIDDLLNEIGRTSKNSRGIPMKNKTPWKGVHGKDPWSFTFDPSGRHDETTEVAAAAMTTPAAPLAHTLDEIDLTPRRMSDSYVEVTLPLLSDRKLLNEYISTSGGVRIGKLMENLDSLAGAIAYKHVLPPDTTDFKAASDKAHVYLATASADRLDLIQSLTVQDLRLSGHVCFAGNSSMEVFIKMEGLREGGDPETLMLGRFTMVARDSRTHKARKINPLLVETPAERDLFEIASEHKARKQDSTRASLSRRPPTTDEITKLHEFMLAHQGLKRGQDEDLVLTRETVISETALMHPQNSNLHSKIFGGYLMRLAYELSYSGAILFARSPLRFQALDEISFAMPVPIGSVLRLTATVTRSAPETNQIHSQVAAEVVNVSTGETRKTNDLHFTFMRDDGEPLTRRIVPETYHEAMAWLSAERRMKLGNEMRAQLADPPITVVDM